MKFHDILPVTDNLFHADERTDRHDEANSRFFVILRNVTTTVVQI